MHVDDIDSTTSATDEVTVEMYNAGDEQQLIVSSKVIERTCT